jgi:hypothetical protein
LLFVYEPLNHYGGKIMNREILEKPFEPGQIKQREGNFGKMLDYIEGHAVIERLNMAFEAEWSFSILEHRILEETDEALVVGQLKAGDVVKTQFGSSRITRARESGEPISLADDFKAAATDSIKKCASLLGVGLHLYNGGKQAADRKSNHTQNQRSYSNQGRATNHPDNRSRSNKPDNGNGSGNGRLSGKQYKYIMRLNEDLGRSKADLDAHCLEGFGMVAQYLSKTDASALIDHLLAQ